MQFCLYPCRRKRGELVKVSFQSIHSFTIIRQMAPLPSWLSAAMENDVIAGTWFYVTYKAPRCNTFKYSVAGVAIGPTVIGACTQHLPPSRIHAPATNPRLGQTRDKCTRLLFSGEGAGVRGANVGSRDVNWRAWLMDDSCSRPTVLGHARCLRYWQPAKVHKAAGAILHRSCWLIAKTNCSCYVICCGGAASLILSK